MHNQTTTSPIRRINIVIGCVLIAFAALCSISLLLQFLGYTASAVAGFVIQIPAFLLLPGVILNSVYGFSSILIPLFLCMSALCLFVPGWSFKRGVYLAGSIFPFFTIVIAESLFYRFSGNSSRTVEIIRSVITFFSTGIIAAIEYLVLGIFSDFISSGRFSVVKIPVPVSERMQREVQDIEPEEPDKNDKPVEGVITEDERAWLFQDDTEPKAAMPEIVTAENENTPVEETATLEGEKERPEEPIFLDLHWKDEAPQPADFNEMENVPDLETIIEEDEYDDISMINEAEERFLNDPFEEYKENLADTEAYDIDANMDEEVSIGGIIRPFADERERLPVQINVLHSLEDQEELLDGDLLADDEDFLTEDILDEQIFAPVMMADPLDNEEKDFSNIDCPPAGIRPIKVPAKNRGTYYVPVDGILTSYPDGKYWIIDDATRSAAIVLKETLQEFKIEAEVMGIRKGPVITMFEILPAPGVRLNKIVALQDNISLRLAASSVRIVAPIPGKHAVGIEVPNKERAIVSFRELIETDIPAFKKMEIPVILGKDITGEAKILDLTTTPHLLIAGSTGSGKSVCVNSIILSILYKRSPQDVRMILIDPKIVELKLYNDIPHLLTPVITESKKAFQALQYCLCEMERRYALLDHMGVRDIKSYNRRIVERNIAAEKLPYIVVIIDEFADLMATTGKELESTVARLAAMSRAVGVHLVLATQRPSIDVITGLIKANIPTRIAFMVASKMDSRIIIDQVGAEKLLGKGDMLYASAVDPFPVRIQGTFVSEEEVENVVDYVKQYGEPEYIDEEIFFDDDEDETIDLSLFSEGDDPLYDKALEIVLQAGKASASYIQRRLKIGYNRAARLVEEMEDRGIVGPSNGSKPRDVVHVPV